MSEHELLYMSLGFGLGIWTANLINHIFDTKR